MTPLLFRCPKTAKPIDPGIEIDRDSLAMVRTTSATVACPHCGEDHEIPLSEAIVEEEAA